jgi:hypothetical protein
LPTSRTPHLMGNGGSRGSGEQSETTAAQNWLGMDCCDATTFEVVCGRSPCRVLRACLCVTDEARILSQGYERGDQRFRSRLFENCINDRQESNGKRAANGHVIEGLLPLRAKSVRAARGERQSFSPRRTGLSSRHASPHRCSVRQGWTI